MLAPFLWVEMLNPATLAATEEQPVGGGEKTGLGHPEPQPRQPLKVPAPPGWASSSHVLRRAQGARFPLRGLGGVYTTRCALPEPALQTPPRPGLALHEASSTGGTGVAAGRGNGEHSQGTPPQLHGFADPTPHRV